MAITDIIQITYGDQVSARTRQVAEDKPRYGEMSARKIGRVMRELEAKMLQFAENLEFEEAARVRDEIQQIKEQTLVLDALGS